MTLDHLNIYKHPDKTCQTIEIYLESGNHVGNTSPVSRARMILAYAKASLLLDSNVLTPQEIVELYSILLKDGKDTDQFEIRLFISDVLQFLDNQDLSLEWLEMLEYDKVIGLTPSQSARIKLRLCNYFMKMQQLHISYSYAKTAHSLALMTESAELIVLTLLQLSAISKLSGDYLLTRQYLSKAKRLSVERNIPWLYGKVILELGEVDQFLGAKFNAQKSYLDALHVFKRMGYAGGYARAVMNLIHEFSKSDTKRIGPLMEEACDALSQMRGADPYRLWLNIQVLSLYDKFLEPSQLKKYKEKHDEIKARVVDNYSKNTINCSTLLKDLKQVKYEINVLEQAKSSTRISVAAIDFYRSSMNKRIDTASHEIRNAVSILKMSVEAVKDGHIDFNKGMIETMLRKIESIGCIVDELDLEDEKQLSIQKMPSQTSVDHIASYCEMAYAYVDNRVHIHRDNKLDERHVVATLLPVTQVIDNLISNALKYSPGTSKVHIHYEERSNFITFHIQDQGCGISEQDQIHIFEPYFRASGTKEEEGKGLGLHYCRQTIQMLGGNIWVKSHLGKGSEFSFSLPVKIV